MSENDNGAPDTGTAPEQQQPEQQPAGAPNTAPSPDHDTDNGQDGETQAPKTFTQAELDKIVGDRTARAEAKAERRVLRTFQKMQGIQQAPAQAQPQQQDDARPNRAYYATEDAYTDALVDWKVGERDRQTEATRAGEQRREIAAKTEKFYAEAGKIPGFDREDFDALPLSPSMVHAMLDSDVAPQLMAVMAEAPEEIARIAKLSPARQAAEIGKLEIKAAELKTTTRPRASKAPAPFEPIGGRGGAHAGNVETMSNDDYRAMRRKQGASWDRGR